MSKSKVLVALGLPVVSVGLATEAGAAPAIDDVITIPEAMPADLFEEQRLLIEVEAPTQTDFVVAAAETAPPEILSLTPPVSPEDGTITANLKPLEGGNIREESLNNGGVALYKKSTNTPIYGTATTSGGGDTITFHPESPLEPNTEYLFVVNPPGINPANAVVDDAGNAVKSYSGVVPSGQSAASLDNVAYKRINLPTAEGAPYSSIERGPDGRLWALTLTGEIHIFDVTADGLSAPKVITAIKDKEGADRYVLGITFGPDSTPENPVVYVTHSDAYMGSGAPAPKNWSGKVTRLSGPNLEQVEDIIINLPRSSKDHAINAIKFDPNNPRILYFLVGSQSANGAPDPAWEDRQEELGSGSLWRVDLDKRPAGQPIDVKTREGGTYNPLDPNAAATLWATGIRNAYDMVVLPNSDILVFTNSSSSGGNAPAGATVPGIKGNTHTAPDHVYLVRAANGAMQHFGHPNPELAKLLNDEGYLVLNGGNPTDGADPQEEPDYATGVKPSSKIDFSAIFDVNEHASLNGATYVKTGPLAGYVIATRFSQGQDMVAFKLNPDNTIAAMIRIKGFDNLNNPLDVIHWDETDTVYFTEFNPNTGEGRISALVPA